MKAFFNCQTQMLQRDVLFYEYSSGDVIKGDDDKVKKINTYSLQKTQTIIMKHAQEYKGEWSQWSHVAVKDGVL